MNTSPSNQYDSIERLIFETGIRILGLAFDLDRDAMVVTLKSGKQLPFRLSAYRALHGKTVEELQQYELIADGLGVHWPHLDEDLSLKGFLEEELKLVAGEYSYAMAA
jgi:hypothetical protein